MSDEIPPAFSEFSVGSQIAGYRLEEQIGRGGMAVHRAYDARLDRPVALKILAPGLALDEVGPYAGRVSETPRELAVEPNGNTLLATDNYSGQLQAVEVGSLP